MVKALRTHNTRAAQALLVERSAMQCCVRVLLVAGALEMPIASARCAPWAAVVVIGLVLRASHEQLPQFLAPPSCASCVL